ncbi:hypothetical protein N8J89_31350 [Crossiella sp. CA-258035]|uniref:hypothetical protein n=1 Tax=Crossiella sp. CA-258035 TaxID=2981138 RepID=UPI0024BD1B19|nr:hypothetical protein [Crossiella sp. CA-258035]WHT17591.1 hypothetical protein N8J89_31350 [Crossiella sp. CA-258035]
MTRTVVVALLSAALLTACGNPASPASPTPPQAPASSASGAATSESSAAAQHVLELEVTGSATLSTATFTLDGKVSEEESVKLPWRKTVTVPFGTGRHEWKLTMQHTGGTMSATATVNGKLVTRTGGGGSPGTKNTANLSGSFTD